MTTEETPEVTYLEKLEAWFKDQKENHGLVDVKFFPHYLCLPGCEPIPLSDSPPPTIEEAAKTAYLILTGKIPSRRIDVSELDAGEEDVSEQEL